MGKRELTYDVCLSSLLEWIDLVKSSLQLPRLDHIEELASIIVELLLSINVVEEGGAQELDILRRKESKRQLVDIHE